MHTAGWAFAWQIWRSQRWLLIPPLVYLPVLALLIHALPAGTLDPKVVVQLALPLAYLVPLLLAIFTFGEQGDLLARESVYPRRMYTLPLRTTALVGWPLALGALAIGGWWLVVSALVLRPALPVSVPVVWPAVFLVALLAWTQALTWLPFPLTVLRMLVMIPVLSALIVAAILGAEFEVPAAIMLTASAGLIPVGYALAVTGVARARRGDVPVYAWPILQRPATRGEPGGQPFPSAWAALAWLEWRSHVFLLPMMALLVLMLLPLVYFLTSDEMLPLLVSGLVCYPIMIAFATGASFGNCHPWARNEPAVPVFLAARPIRSVALLAVKLQGVTLATLATWGMLGVGLALTLPFCRGGTLLMDGLRLLYETQGALRGTCLLLLIVLGLPALSWKWVVDHLWIGLAGRYWVILTAAIVFGVLLTGMGLVGAWAYNDASFRAWLVPLLPWALAVALILKVGAGAYVGRQLIRRGLVTRRTVLRLAAAWLAAAAGLLALTDWLVPAPLDSRLVLGGAVVLLALPLARLAAAPLALDWNRHR